MSAAFAWGDADQTVRVRTHNDQLTEAKIMKWAGIDEEIKNETARYQDTNASGDLYKEGSIPATR